MPDRVYISIRLKIVKTKDRFLGLGRDIIIEKNHKDAIITINDRAISKIRIQN